MSQIKTVSAKEAIATFKYLYEYKPEIYARKTIELTVDEYITYQMALTVPKLDEPGKQWVKIDEPFIVFEYQGQEYLSSGNSRLQTIDRMIKGGSKEQFADIRYIVLDEWNDQELVRIQYATNDLTRKNSRLKKLRQIAEYVTRLINSGTKQAIARDEAKIRFSVSPTDIKNAFLISDAEMSETLSDMLDKDLIKTDPAIELINIKNSLGVDSGKIISDLLTSNLPLSLGNVRKWRNQYETDLKSLEENKDNVTPEKGSKGGDGGGGNTKKPHIPPVKPEKSENNVESTTKKLGEFDLKTADDAANVALILSNLIEKNRVNRQSEIGELVINRLFETFQILSNLELPIGVQEAIASQLKSKSKSDSNDVVQESVIQETNAPDINT